MYPISEQTQVYGRTFTKLSFPRNHGQSNDRLFKKVMENGPSIDELPREKADVPAPPRL